MNSLPKKNLLSYELVPWFSREEWKYVYNNVFSNKIEDWREAYQQISVWKARVTKLPIGIEGTLPLLHAQMAQLDTAMEDSFKMSILNMAIVRFVSIVTKGYEDRFKVDKPMQSVASCMNLPPYLIDLRHQIIHSDSVFGTSQTLTAAVETSMEWIKIHYWEEEEKRQREKMRQLRTFLKKPEQQLSNEVAVESNECSEVPSEKESTGEHQDKFKNALRDYMERVVDFMKKEISNSPDAKPPVSKFYIVKKRLSAHLIQNVGGAVKILVEELFYANLLEDLVMKRKQIKSDTCPCRCPIPKHFFFGASQILKMLFKLRALNSFTQELLRQGKEHQVLCEAWLRSLVLSSKKTAKNKCSSHIFKVAPPMMLRKAISWRNLLFELFALGTVWSARIGIQFSRLGVMKINGRSRAFLKEVSNIYLVLGLKKKRRESEEKQENKGNHKNPTDDLLSLEHVLKEAKRKSDQVHQYVENVCSLVTGLKKAAGQRKLSEDSLVILGVLPHQEKDPNFFLQLVLQPSGEMASCKSKKFSEITSDS